MHESLQREQKLLFEIEELIDELRQCAVEQQGRIDALRQLKENFSEVWRKSDEAFLESCLLDHAGMVVKIELAEQAKSAAQKDLDTAKIQR